MEKYNKSRAVAREYLIARQKLLEYANKSSELNGNDNIIGRIGEFIAYLYLIDRQPIVNSNKTQKGYDIVCSDNSRVQVKLITAENKSGRTTKVGYDWDELIVIELNEKFEVFRLGHVTRTKFEEYLNSSFKKDGSPVNQNPVSSRTML